MSNPDMNYDSDESLASWSDLHSRVVAGEEWSRDVVGDELEDAYEDDMRALGEDEDEGMSEEGSRVTGRTAMYAALEAEDAEVSELVAKAIEDRSAWLCSRARE